MLFFHSVFCVSASMFLYYTNSSVQIIFINIPFLAECMLTKEKLFNFWSISVYLTQLWLLIFYIIIFFSIKPTLILNQFFITGKNISTSFMLLKMYVGQDLSLFFSSFFCKWNLLQNISKQKEFTIPFSLMIIYIRLYK